MEISKSNRLLLELIQKETSTQEICKKLRINETQLNNKLTQLKRTGFNIQRTYYYNGTSKYKLVKKSPVDYTTIHDVPENLFRAVAISDLHIGSKQENLDYLKKVYEYCTYNDIHIILNGGDIIQGTLGPRKINHIIDQIEYLLQNHPYDNQILNFITLGNHDYDSLKTLGIDIHTILNENRSDLISLGYGINKIKIRNDFITMAHTAAELKHTTAKLKITGHGHRFQFKNQNEEPSLFLPTLSDEIKDDFLPGMVEINLLMENNEFYKGIFRQFIIANNLTPSGNITHLFQETTSKTLKK